MFLSSPGKKFMWLSLISSVLFTCQEAF